MLVPVAPPIISSPPRAVGGPIGSIILRLWAGRCESQRTKHSCYQTNDKDTHDNALLQNIHLISSYFYLVMKTNHSTTVHHTRHELISERRLPPVELPSPMASADPIEQQRRPSQDWQSLAYLSPGPRAGRAAPVPTAELL